MGEPLDYEEQMEIRDHMVALGYVEDIQQHPLKLLFFGVDALDLREVIRYRDDGAIPTFQSLMAVGSWGMLWSQNSGNTARDAPHTGPNWLSIYTGQTIEEHGVKSHGWATGSETWKGHRTIWEELAETYRVGLMTLPVTYPPKELGEGSWMVSGFPAAFQTRRYWWPPDIEGGLDEGFVPYDGWTGKPRTPDKWSRLWDVARMKLPATRRLTCRFETEILAFGLSTVDAAYHSSWAKFAKDRDGDEFLTRRRQAYEVADQCLETLLRWYKPESIIICGDHGFGLLYHSVEGFYLTWPKRISSGWSKDIDIWHIHSLIKRAVRTTKG